MTDELRFFRIPAHYFNKPQYGRPVHESLRETFDLMACMAFILSEVSFLDYLVFLLRNISFFEQ